MARLVIREMIARAGYAKEGLAHLPEPRQPWRHRRERSPVASHVQGSQLPIPFLRAILELGVKFGPKSNPEQAAVEGRLRGRLRPAGPARTRTRRARG